MRRAFRILAAGLLVGLIPVSVSGCAPSCCAFPPSLDANAATSLAVPVTGSDGQSPNGMRGPHNYDYWEVRGGSSIALINDEVFEAVFETRMPNTDSLTVDSGQAKSAAESYVETAGYVTSVDLARYRESTHEVHQAGVALIDVTLFSPPADESPTPLPGATVASDLWHDLDVLVNGSSGMVFALVDHNDAWGSGTYSGILAPIVGKDRAAELAQSAASRPGLVVISAELHLDLSGDEQHSYWDIGLGPSASSASATATVTVNVDANTGQAEVQS